MKVASFLDVMLQLLPDCMQKTVVHIHICFIIYSHFQIQWYIICVFQCHSITCEPVCWLHEGLKIESLAENFYWVFWFHIGSWESVVSVVTLPWAVQSRVQILPGARDLFLLWNVQTSSGILQPCYVVGTESPFPRVKATGAWVWPLPPSSAKVESEWSCTSLPQHVFVGCTGALGPTYSLLWKNFLPCTHGIVLSICICLMERRADSRKTLIFHLLWVTCFVSGFFVCMLLMCIIFPLVWIIPTCNHVKECQLSVISLCWPVMWNTSSFSNLL